MIKRELWYRKTVKKDGTKIIKPVWAYLKHPASYSSWFSWKLDQAKYDFDKKVRKLPLGTQSTTGTSTSVTTADSWTEIAAPTSPAAMKRIKKVRFGLAADPGLTATSIRQAPAFRLMGSGLLEQSPHEFLGMWGGYAAVTTAGYAQSQLDIEYDVDIPVQVGGAISVQVNILREAQTAGDALFNLLFDEKPPAAVNSMSQYVEAAGTTTADAWAALGSAMTVPTAAKGASPSKTKAITVAVAPDPGTSAISVRIAPRFRISGGGLAEGGDHEYLGPVGTTAETGSTPSQGVAHDMLTRMIMVEIPVNPAGSITAEHRFSTETPTASSVGLAIHYQ